ncbi:MAG: membrane protein insertion efficiency factor YidD [Vampirovibrionales bacterium]|nr:membrane protein insertion efficiency factor YidD [Vampirovibrionales bacterium]
MSASAVYYPTPLFPASPQATAWQSFTSPPALPPNLPQSPPFLQAPPEQARPLPEPITDTYQPQARDTDAMGSAGNSPNRPGKVTIKIPTGLPLLTTLQPGQEIPEELRQGLNPLQQAGVWMIENCYQRLAMKQSIYGQLADSGFDVCAYSRRAKEAGHKEWESCSQYTKMAIVHDGFFKGGFKGFIRIMSCNPILFNKHHWDWSERFIEHHAKAREKNVESFNL